MESTNDSRTPAQNHHSGVDNGLLSLKMPASNYRIGSNNTGSVVMHGAVELPAVKGINLALAVYMYTGLDGRMTDQHVEGGYKQHFAVAVT
ncbi:unnamed protein product [Phytophthora fragariaefolia]|uniref:Unnamed protein product n=1 Tax=Phytophthora fragariaefolia TaxID=1490495 RepID=A0A9W6YAY4_9STRA|nr:unnamed protein product [Phytophthora fragariaefolia]